MGCGMDGRSLRPLRTYRSGLGESEADWLAEIDPWRWRWPASAHWRFVSFSPAAQRSKWLLTVIYPVRERRALIPLVGWCIFLTVGISGLSPG